MIPLCIPHIEGNEWMYIKDCLDTNWVSSVGSYVNKFEVDFAKFVDTPTACVTVNGTTALDLSLKVLEIGKGDEVLIPSLTFIAPVNTIKYNGAKPVFVDACRDTFLIDTNKIESLITKKTKAIIPVHLYGNMCNMEQIISIARKYNLFVIEDATESLGSYYKNKHAGTIGDIGCFSFNGNKMITTGAGGMIVSENPEYVERAKFLSNQARLPYNIPGSFYYEEIGYNYRMPNIVAAMGCAQLEQLNKYLKLKITHAQQYNELLKDKKGITISKQTQNSINSYWLYSILIEDDYKMSRDDLVEYLGLNKIESRPFFYPAHMMPHYRKFSHNDLKVTEELWTKGINLPSSVSLTNEEIDTIVNLL